MYLKPLHLPKARVLVLEDDCVLRRGLRGVLADAGYALSEGGEGDPDLIIAGQGSRHALGQRLVSFDQAPPVLMLVDRAAWDSFDFFDAANALGAAAALQRPFNRGALLRLVARVLSGSPAETVDEKRRDFTGPCLDAESWNHG